MKSSILLVMLALALTANVRGADRPNVLLIVADDLNARLGCYGDKVVQTPNIDRLASRGVRFDRAYCQYPVCNPSRISFLSGLYPDTTRVFDQATLLRSRMPDAVFLPEHFRSNGYFTAGIGKVEHGGHYEIKWDVIDDFKGAGGADDEDAPATRPKRGQRTRRPEAALTYEVKRATEDGDPENVDDQIAAKVIKLIEEKREKPFFVVAGFHKPHVPHVAPKRFFDLYPPAKMQLTPVAEDDAKDIPPQALANKRNYQPDMSAERQRDIIAAYYACTSYLDAKVGDVMETMDRQKLWGNTIVVFIGDHGWGFGEHHWWAKASLFEPSARVPMIVVAPGVKAGASPRVAQLLDLYPTLAELCALPKPPQSQGRSIVPLLHEPMREWDGAAVTASGPRGRSIRDERYRYTEWDGGKLGVELYDHESDPSEWKNLAQDPAQAAIIARLKERLNAVTGK